MASYRRCALIFKRLRLNHKHQLFRSSRHTIRNSILSQSKYKPVLSRLNLKYNHNGWQKQQTRHFGDTPPSNSKPATTQSNPEQKETALKPSHDPLGHAVIDYSTIYKERTGVTSGLWRLRLNLTQEDKTLPKVPPQRAPLVEKPPWQSSIVVCYDFNNNKSILNEYIRFDGGVRFGRILEDMDSLAGNVAETHGDNDDGYPISFVTASVDRIDLKRRFPLNRCLIMQGTPIYVGRSSVNVQIKVMDKFDENIEICSANFIMVARDGITGITNLISS